MRMLALSLAAVLVVSACGGDDDEGESSASNGCEEVGAPEPKPEGTRKAPTELLDESKTFRLVVETNCGEFTIELDQKSAPKTTASLVALARDGFYDDTIIHRVVPVFVIQGGDPTGTGTGGPGYTIQDEPVKTPYLRGTVAMARTADPNSVGSQFFIVLDDKDQSVLGAYNTYQIIGSVTKGMEAADAIAAAADAENPSQPIPMTKVTVAP